MPRQAERASKSGQPRWVGKFEEGLALGRQGCLEEAARCFLEVLERQPALPEGWRNLGSIRAGQGRHAEAEACLRRALRLRPDFAEAYNDLGCVLGAQGRQEEALECYRRASEASPSLAEAHFNLGRALQQAGRFEQAQQALRTAVRLRPDWPEALALLASALLASRKFDEAARYARRALRADPDSPLAHNALGVALEAKGEPEAALRCYEAALARRPAFAEAASNRGNVLARLGRLREAEQAYRQALALNPSYAAAWNNLASILERQGEIEGAIACYREALACAPDFALAHSNLLLALHYDPSADRRAIYAEHLRWAAAHGLSVPAVRSWPNQPDPERPLRLAYLSPDFRRHSVAFFIEPVLASHDRSQFRVVCFSDVLRPDETTARLRSLADEWVDISESSDEEAARCIEAAGIDILVDLAGHTAGGRPRVLARKPAPVVVTWLGYPDTTGLHTVDYRITDEDADPPGEADRFHSEELLRLPAPFLCYLPPAEAPDVGPLPARARGTVTFGAFHNLAKINQAVARAWAEILGRVAGARLFVKTAALGDADVRRRLARLLGEAGAPLERVEMRGHARALPEHLAGYHEVDIALDSFPYSGTTTTCEALWMGVPVVTLAGAAHVSRTGMSILKSVGLSELATDSVSEYVARAVALAEDLDRLERLRATMRERMAASRLLRADLFTRDLEAAYRQMWRRWCAKVSC